MEVACLDRQQLTRCPGLSLERQRYCCQPSCCKQQSTNRQAMLRRRRQLFTPPNPIFSTTTLSPTPGQASGNAEMIWIIMIGVIIAFSLCIFFVMCYNQYKKRRAGTTLNATITPSRYRRRSERRQSTGEVFSIDPPSYRDLSDVGGPPKYENLRVPTTFAIRLESQSSVKSLDSAVVPPPPYMDTIDEREGNDTNESRATTFVSDAANTRADAEDVSPASHTDDVTHPPPETDPGPSSNDADPTTT